MNRPKSAIVVVPNRIPSDAAIQERIQGPAKEVVKQNHPAGDKAETLGKIHAAQATTGLEDRRLKNAALDPGALAAAALDTLPPERAALGLGIGDFRGERLGKR